MGSLTFAFFDLEAKTKKINLSQDPSGKKEFIKERKPIQRVKIDEMPLLNSNNLQTQEEIKQERWLIDKIIAQVNNKNILHSDLTKPRVVKEGKQHSLDEIVTEELFLQHAQRIGLYPSGLDVERQIANAKAAYTENGGSEEDFYKEVKEFGLSLDEYKEQIARWIAVENVKRAELGEKITVTTQEIEEYCAAHPEETAERYYLHVAIIPAGKEKELKQLIKEKKLSWLDLGWIEKQDLAQEYSFVARMHKGQISKAFTTGGTPARYKSIKLVNKEMPRLKSIEERYNDIEHKLFYKKREQLFAELQEKLRSKASISLRI